MFRDNIPLTYHVHSSIWNGLKSSHDTIMGNYSWQLGTGSCINFWTTPWLSKPLVEIMQIPSQIHSSLQATVQDIISQGNWNIPTVVFQKCAALNEELKRVAIPHFDSDDRRVWSSTTSGETLQDAFLFLNSPGQELSWCKLIWTKFIPPSKSFITWRAMHNRLPTDDNLRSRGCTTVSVCSLCGAAKETTHQLQAFVELQKKLLTSCTWLCAKSFCRYLLSGQHSLHLQ